MSSSYSEAAYEKLLELSAWESLLVEIVEYNNISLDHAEISTSCENEIIRAH